MTSQREFQSVSDDERERSASTEIAWLSNTRFRLKQRALFEADTPDLAREAGPFGKSEAAEARNGQTSSFVRFSAQAICELVRDTCKVVELKPGDFD